MKKTEVMKKLKALGTAQNRKVACRHGITGDYYGVSYANLGMLKRKIKVDHELAERLWATGNHDAQVLATMIADPAKLTARTLDAWVKDTRNRGNAGALSNLAALTSVASNRVDKWTKSRNEWICVTGWHTLASLARNEEALPDSYFEKHLATIEAEIHESKNWVRYAMNNALISIGIRNPGLQKKAVAAAKRIGVVEVDHGETGCKTPEAVSYIAKAVAHNAKKKAKKKANKSAAKKRKAAASAS